MNGTFMKAVKNLTDTGLDINTHIRDETEEINRICK